MAEIREVVIKIKGEEGEKKVTPETNKKTKKVDTFEAVSSIIYNQAFEHLKSEFINELNYEMNKQFVLNDDYVSQRKVTALKNITSRALSIGTSIVSGAKAGSMVLPGVGTAVGAITMAVVSAINLGVDIYQNYDQANIGLRQRNAQLDFTRERAGYSLTSGSVGENR